MGASMAYHHTTKQGSATFKQLLNEHHHKPVQISFINEKQ
jgi:hypothetical protein